MDKSNGYEPMAEEFLAGRSGVIGVTTVRAWAQTLPRGVAAIDLGCGAGIPLTEILVSEGLDVFGVDAAPSLVRAFRRNLPKAAVVCEAVEESDFFHRTFGAVLAWGLLFLLSAEEQRRLIRKISRILAPGGSLLFTSPAAETVWTDVITGRESRSLGSKAYREELIDVGLEPSGECEDEGQNHYFEALKI